MAPDPRSRRTREPLRWILTLATPALAGLLAACSGSDGKDGAPGKDAPPPLTPNQLTRFESAPGVVLTVTKLEGGSGTGGAFQAGDRPVVTYTAKKTSGQSWTLADLSDGVILVSGPTFNYNPVIAPQSDLFSSSIANNDGTFSYTFAAPIPATYLPPANDSPAFGPGDGELQGQTLLAGTYTVGMYGHWNYFVDGVQHEDVGQTTFDFLFGSATTLEPREVVKSDNCNQCHTDIQAHGGSIRTVPLCVLCHTSGAEDGSGNGVSIDFRVMIHKLHDASHLPSVLGVATNPDGSRNYAATPVPYVLTDGQGNQDDLSNVNFPVWPSLNFGMPRDLGYSALTSTQKGLEDTIRKGAVDCDRCHGDPDGSGPLTAPSQGNIRNSQPTRRACGACHDDIDWTRPYTANGLTMGAQANDSSCLFCHVPTGSVSSFSPLSTAQAHLHPLSDPAVNPGVDIDITGVSGGSGAGGNFVDGDVPSVTFTVKDDSGADVPLGNLDSFTAIVVGPTTNRQLVFAQSSPTGASSSPPVDFSGRLSIASSSGRGSMSKATGATANETLTVQFTSTTAFDVTGTTSGALGSSALPATPSTNPSGSSLSAVVLSPTAVAQTVTVAFSSDVAFTVTGSVSGAMGSGTMPASLSASTRFTSGDGTLAFTITSGSSNPFASGNNIYLAIFQGSGANPVLFAIVAGTTSFAATDRFYYDTVAPASSYTFAMPMDLPTETLGNGNGAAGQVLTAGNLPVYFGRQTVLERTALVGGAMSSSAATAPRDRFAVVTSIDPALADGDDVVISLGGGLAAEEHVEVGFIDTATNTLWFATPLRNAHAAGSHVQKVTLTFRREGSDYSLNAANGTITSITPFGVGNAVVMNYRTDGRFGWHRFDGDSLQAVYPPPPADSPDLGQDWGEWQGLAFESGTYTAQVWGNATLYVPIENEIQTYRATAVSKRGQGDFLYGAATTLVPYAAIDTGDNCNACHGHVMFHGGGRWDFETCVTCHGVAGAEDDPRYDDPGADATPGVTINLRTMLHKIHMGSSLTFASTYEVSGSFFDEVEFPDMTGGVANCRKCHGTADAWQAPLPRNDPNQTIPTRAWRATCGSCHDADSAQAHIDANTSATGVESCEVCHGTDGEFAVELMHRSR